MAKRGRVFLRGMTSEIYGLKEFRTAQLRRQGWGRLMVVDDAKVATPELRPVTDLVAGRPR